MSNDLVHRLRDFPVRDCCSQRAEAADRIEALEKALRHCVNAIALLEKCKTDEEKDYRLAFGLEGFLFGAMDAARAALEGKDD